jgi:hypothetical protein
MQYTPIDFHDMMIGGGPFGRKGSVPYTFTALCINGLSRQRRPFVPHRRDGSSRLTGLLKLFGRIIVPSSAVRRLVLLQVSPQARAATQSRRVCTGSPGQGLVLPPSPVGSWTGSPGQGDRARQDERRRSSRRAAVRPAGGRRLPDGEGPVGGDATRG